jgi:hypothetical protein
VSIPSRSRDTGTSWMYSSSPMAFLAAGCKGGGQGAGVRDHTPWLCLAAGCMLHRAWPHLVHHGHTRDGSSALDLDPLLCCCVLAPSGVNATGQGHRKICYSDSAIRCAQMHPLFTQTVRQV